jgi:hypothetical protein
MDKKNIQSIIIVILLCYILVQNFFKIQYFTHESTAQLKVETNEEMCKNFCNSFKSTNEELKLDLKSAIKNNINQFKSLGDKSGTDKTTFHHYEHLYGQHIGQYRDSKINFLEIGIGCGMGYGAGKSLPVWKEFLPLANIYEMEFNAPCAEEFRSKVKQLFTGDQSDLSLLKKIGDEVGHFEVIVDDGGHSRKQQVNSLIGLWPYLSSEGVYIIEDMYHSFVDHKQFNDNDESSIDLIMELLIIFNDPSPIPYIQSLSSPMIKPNLTIRSHAEEISKTLLSINCFRRACVLYKK